MEVPATEIPSSQLITEDIKNIIPYLDKYGVCVVPLKNISTGTRNRYLLRTNFYQNANQILSEEHQIPEHFPNGSFPKYFYFSLFGSK